MEGKGKGWGCGGEEVKGREKREGVWKDGKREGW